MKLVLSTMKNLCIFSMFLLFNGCSSLPAEKQSFNNQVDKASSDDIRAISTVRHVYCTGDWYKLYKTRASYSACKKWAVIEVKSFSQSSSAVALNKDISRFRYVSGGQQYLWILKDMVHGDSASAYNQEANEVITLVEGIDTDLARANLFAFYNDYYRHDKNSQKRTALAKRLCAEEQENGKNYCRYFAKRLYLDGKYTQAAKLYENYGTGGDSYSQLYLAKIHLYYSGELNLKKLSKANNLLKAAFDSKYDGLLKECIDEKSSSHKDCTQLKAVRDEHFLFTRSEYTFLKDNQLQRSIRIDKYKLALSQHLKSKEYESALQFFGFFDRLDYKLSNSMLFFKAESLFNTGKISLANDAYNQYLNTEGKKGSYYKKSLQRLSEIEQINLQ
jgi:hypothetical protein